MKFFIAIHPSPVNFIVFLTTVVFPQAEAQSIVERTNSLSLLLGSIQCFPDLGGDGENKTSSTQLILDINKNFDPEANLDLYKNPKDVERLVDFVERSNLSGFPFRNDDPFTNSPEHVSQLSLILHVLYPNSDNWPLFYNTSVWLLDRVNSAQLFWALMIVAGEKFSDTVTVPTSVEVFPQLFIHKKEVLKAAGLSNASSQNDDHTATFPLQYWNSDPGLNEFHTHWHMDNPFWWDEKVYGVTRYRKGELFLYMHHQLVCRYNAELLGNGIGEVTPLELDQDYQFPEGYIPDIVNVNFGAFPVRTKGERFGSFDSGKSLNQLKTWFDRLSKGIEQGYFQGPRQEGNPQISLQGDNGTDILGKTVESDSIHSANLEYYGNFHNYLHRELGGMSKESWKTPGVEAHSETAIRDPVFFRLHSKIDSLFLKFKSMTPAYTKNDLVFPGVSIKSVDIQTPRNRDDEDEPHWPFDIRWPFVPQMPALTTYFEQEIFDISTAARPCRAIGDEPIYANMKTLSYVPFKYVITLQSTRPQTAYGMVRIFIWPEFTQDGKKLEEDDAHQRAIELDRFRVQIDAGRDTIITRSSLNSSLTRLEPPPGIKALFKAKASSSHLRPEMRRACGFPNNLLIPKGTKEGIKYKLTVYVSDETEMGLVAEYPNYPLCGALNGIPYPDRRPMGFPFDRPGTRFIANEGFWPVVGVTTMKNVKEIKVLVKHQDS